jgi:hypothetical protein
MALPALAIAGIAAGVSALGAGVTAAGQARAAKKRYLSEAEKRELESLERRKAAGELGLTEKERGRMEQQFLAEQAGAQRELEATALQQAAARGLGGAVSGRDIFLQEQAQAQAELGMRQEQNVLVQQAEIAEAAAEEARIQAMRLQQKEAEAARTAAIWGAVGGALGAGAQGLSSYSSQAQAAEMQTKQLEAQAQQTKDLMRMYQYSGGGPTFGRFSTGGF